MTLANRAQTNRAQNRELKALNVEKSSPLKATTAFVKRNTQKLELRLYRLRGGKIANFLHIPKTGGKAVKHSLRPVPETDAYRIHLRGHSCRLSDIPVGDTFFFFLRDPAQRFISAFNHKKSGKGRWQHTKIVEETAALEQFESANHLAESLSANDPVVQAQANTAMNSMIGAMYH